MERFKRGIAALLAGARDATVGPVAEVPHRWPSDRRWRLLITLCAALLATGYAGGAIGQMMSSGVQPSLAVVLGLAQAAPLVVAVRWPLAAWRVMAVGMLAGAVLLSARHLFWPWSVTTWLSMIAVLFYLGICYERRTAIGAGVVTALAVVLPAVPIDGMSFWFALILWGTIALALAFADALSGRRAAEVSLAEQSELRRHDLARAAVLEERTRIARELHDVVAHHMSVIALQAEAAPYKMRDLSPAAQRTFEVIRGAARDALAETRRIVGLIREDDEEVERLPQPGLDRLDGLVESARQAGLTVDSRIVGVPRPVTAGLDLSAYRIVQEALSNAARHAAGSSVQIFIRYGRERLAVSVADSGTRGGGRSGPGGGRSGPGGGHGLVGMRERVAMLGGTLVAGPRAGGGFDVTVELPYGAGTYGALHDEDDPGADRRRPGDDP